MEGSLEKRLYDAAAEGNTISLQELLEKDKFLLDRVSFTSPNKNSQQSSPLHIASAEGYLEIVKKLLSAAPHMCLSRDCQGRNPLHLAAMRGHVEILNTLIQESPSAARAKAGRDQTVLHLCVKHGQLEAFKILAPNLKGRIDAKDVDGDTALDMAVEDKQFEIIRYLVGSTEIDLNVRNSNGQTAIDILEEGQPGVDYIQIKNILRRVRRIDTKIQTQTQRIMKWLPEKGNVIMVVAVLIATVAFQAGVSPAGGIWQENSTQNSHARAGEAVMA
ncbi:hypothetical protein BUALT_Bualt03G0199800 [Buddleja alternifolia]|uniref:PGG domain-containing protein n=1 Tax=Buddleja alternifolia TaxID=168488 RepID=A0AAV6XX04_9LAMI|nr:hypothetical protein BUALT_Bualt03G0199800 [Buddleja alternifolia]